MTVYVLAAEGYDWHSIIGVFSTREKAEAYQALLPEEKRSGTDIEEREIDGEIGKAYLPSWRVHSYLAEDEPGHVLRVDSMRFPDAPCKFEFGRTRSGDDWVIVLSPISAEHALEMSAEKCREWAASRPLVVPGLNS